MAHTQPGPWWGWRASCSVLLCVVWSWAIRSTGSQHGWDRRDLTAHAVPPVPWAGYPPAQSALHPSRGGRPLLQGCPHPSIPEFCSRHDSSFYSYSAAGQSSALPPKVWELGMMGPRTPSQPGMSSLSETPHLLVHLLPALLGSTTRSPQPHCSTAPFFAKPQLQMHPCDFILVSERRFDALGTQNQCW